MWKVVKKLLDNELQVDFHKSQFHIASAKKLAFIISTKGIEVDSETIKAH